MEPTQGTPSASVESSPNIAHPDEASQATPEAPDQTITKATTCSNRATGPSDYAQIPNATRATGSAQSLDGHVTDNVNHSEILKNTLGLRLLDTHEEGPTSSRKEKLDEQDLFDENDETTTSQRTNEVVGDTSASPAVTDAFLGRGLPTTDIRQLGSPGPNSVITDLGSRFVLTRKESNASSFDSEPGPLQDQITSACVESAQRHGHSFLPNRQLVKIITKDAVKEELLRPKRPKRVFPSWNLRPPANAEDIETAAHRICGSWEQEHHQEAQSPKTPGSPTPPQPPSRAKTKSFRKIFAILVLIELPHAIHGFVQEGVSDVDLPFVKAKNKFRIHPSQRWGLRIKGHEGTPVECVKSWKQNEINKFVEKQWTMLAPFFALGGPKTIASSKSQQSYDLRTIHHYPLLDSVVLPFTEWEEVKRRGGCGQVFRAKIHRHHHGFHTHSHGDHKDVYAVKELVSQNEANFTREVGMLKRLTGDLAHNHLISLLATYHHRGRYHLIFPWAPFDLLGYWENEKLQPEKNRDTALWVAEQCQGLAEGLAKIHRYPTNTDDSILAADAKVAKKQEDSQQAKSNSSTVKTLFGRHGDIKPANILWFPSESGSGKGILKITDFGIAEFTTQDMASRSRVANSVMYRAPETDDKNATITTSYDMWALGCVYLEFIAWYFGGWEGIEAFLDRRLAVDEYYYQFCMGTFFTYEIDGQTGKLQAKVKDSVCEFIDVLQAKSTCPEFFRDFLDMIRDHLLVVRHDGSGRRMSSADVGRNLAIMREKDRKHPEYFAGPAV